MSIRQRFITAVLLSFLLVIIFPLYLNAEDDLKKADELYNKGGLENYKEAITIYLKALENSPNSYAANWKCARAYRDYADEAMIENLPDWKEICAEYGKLGMKYAEKAISIDSKKVDAYYYYGISLGVYSTGVGKIKAIKEGLKDKLIKNMETAYEIDKKYMDGGPPIVLGRFWAQVPWPFRDKDKALKYFRDYQSITKYNIAPDIRRIYIGELLIELGGDDNKKEAKELLELAAQSKRKYYKDMANSLLSKLK
ncbi:MAG: hypothetical protein HQK79_21060 [Desulfobacterales bacterium]|nr:hypothetical protein [Desulfobacterales bacterium]